MGEADKMRESVVSVARQIVWKYVPLMTLTMVAAGLCFPLDQPLEDAVSGYRTPELVTIAEAVTVVGNVYYGVPVILLALLLLKRKEFKRAFLAVALAIIPVFIVKGIVHRQRPVPAGKFDAYPSGHTAAAFSLFGVISRESGKVLWLAVPVLVGASRILLGRHYLSDVVMGAGIGMIMALASEDILRLTRSRA